MIAVIIATLNEQENIGRCIASTRDPMVSQVIIADGGSNDETCGIAKGMDCDIVSGQGFRSLQFNAAIAKTDAGELLFIHGDTMLPPGFGAEVLDVLRQPATVAGAFKLEIEGSGVGLRFISKCVDMRSMIFQMPYGDQGLFMRRDVFETVGGFSPLPIMEDYDMVRRLRRIGRVGLSSMAVSTSARRWKTKGLIRTNIINKLMIAGFHLEISPERLYRLYYGREKHQSRL